MKVSTVSLGSWLTYGGRVEEDVARECMQRAFDSGVNFFDTANVYAHGAAEEVVGRFVAGMKRDDIVVATKVYFPMGEGPNDSGLSRKHVFEQCHRSLNRLGVDYIDLYQCHRFDSETPLEETCSVMNDLIRQGKILYWGVSEWSADQIESAVRISRDRGWTAPSSNQPEYNALQRSIEEAVLPVSEKFGIGNVVWSPLAQGVLTGKYASVNDVPEGSRATSEAAGFMRRYLQPHVLAAVQGLREVASDAGCTMTQLALAWCLRKPQVSSVIVGATKVGHVDENVAAADIELDEETIARVDEALAPVAAEVA